MTNEWRQLKQWLEDAIKEWHDANLNRLLNYNSIENGVLTGYATTLHILKLLETNYQMQSLKDAGYF